eukprot:3422445-Pyramimonas_sp.AAC.1
MGKRRVAIVGAGSECSPKIKLFTLHVYGVLTPFTRPLHTTVGLADPWSRGTPMDQFGSLY